MTPHRSAPGSPSKASELDFTILENLKIGRAGARVGGRAGERASGRAGGRAGERAGARTDGRTDGRAGGQTKDARSGGRAS